MKTAHIFVACAPVTINQANINSVNSYACRSLIHSEQACYLQVFVSALHLIAALTLMLQVAVVMTNHGR